MRITSAVSVGSGLRPALRKGGMETLSRRIPVCRRLSTVQSENKFMKYGVRVRTGYGRS